ncbi:hypothetical protein BGX29_006587 [Mortierella sp. GBA35]|nr:hypothetical protein BGX29_006587 [Mortierella sp. GBA35]
MKSWYQARETRRQVTQSVRDRKDEMLALISGKSRAWAGLRSGSVVNIGSRSSNKKRGRSEGDTAIDERLSHQNLDPTPTTVPTLDIGTPPAKSSSRFHPQL